MVVNAILSNSPDPLELIAKYGADGLRHGIMSIAPKGQDIRFSEDRIEQGRNFCNKLWNVSRFRQMSGTPKDNSVIELILLRMDRDQFTKDDHAILLKLTETLDEVDRLYKAYELIPCCYDLPLSGLISATYIGLKA